MFETGSHVIIGLPDIARTFGTLLIKMIQKAMDNPALLQGSRTRPSAQAVINHSYWSNQSLLTHAFQFGVRERRRILIRDPID